MGGDGSGRWNWHSPKTTVEACLSLDINKLRRDSLLYDPGPEGTARGSLIWHNDQEKTGAAGYRIERNTGGIVYRLLYWINGVDVDLPIWIEWIPQHFGGVRWWFRCPLAVNKTPCGRRAGKLYLPPGGRYFGCRRCHNLTYTSCQESHKFDRALWLMVQA